MATGWLFTEEDTVSYKSYMVDNDVFPKTGSPDPTDVMLVQFLVFIFFQSGEGGVYEREFWAIYQRATANGGRWDDGVYGTNTRQGVMLFERAADSPYKDGVFRRGALPRLDFQYDAMETKLEKLNWIFDRVMGSDSKAKDNYITDNANPALVKALT